MTTSRAKPAQRRPAPTFLDQGLALAWGSWAELGVSGWTATHEDWAIDPEPLIVFTAFLADAEPRLRDEATDWCIRNWRHVSKTRLKNLVAEQPADVQDAFGALSATVSTHAGVAWPNQTEARRFTVTGRSTAPRLAQPSMVWLRLRAMFGLGARAEIMRYFLTTDAAPRASVAAIANAIQYTKRNVADECESLAEAGMLTVRPVRNRYVYSLAKRAELESLLDPLPPIRPAFATLLNVARELIELEQEATSSAVRTLPVKARKVLDRIEVDLDELGIEPPTATGSGLWPAMQQLGTDTLAAWSLGRWHRSV
jgi:hypothetical protein